MRTGRWRCREDWEVREDKGVGKDECNKLWTGCKNLKEIVQLGGREGGTRLAAGRGSIDTCFLDTAALRCVG